jgi:hypothetical protein
MTLVLRRVARLNTTLVKWLEVIDVLEAKDCESSCVVLSVFGATAAKALATGCP